MEVGREGGHYLGVVIITLFYLMKLFIVSVGMWLHGIIGGGD